MNPAPELWTPVAADEKAIEAIDKAQRDGLRDKMFDGFKDWAAGAGFDVSKWTMNAQGVLVNPLGDEMAANDAAASLQRIAQISAIDRGELVLCFHYLPHGKSEPELPCSLTKAGQPALTIWAVWDGRRVLGEARSAMPAAPSLLVSLEGGGPDDGEWKEPAKLYALMEYGFRLGAYKAPRPFEPIEDDSASAFAPDSPNPEDEDIPF